MRGCALSIHCLTASPPTTKPKVSIKSNNQKTSKIHATPQDQIKDRIAYMTHLRAKHISEDINCYLDNETNKLISTNCKNKIAMCKMLV